MSQVEEIKKILRRDGEVSRNYCLANYISRLGAIICKLKKEGWEFDKPDRRAGDYVYILKSSKPKQEVFNKNWELREVYKTPKPIKPYYEYN